MAQPRHSPERPDGRILVVKISSLGDILHAFPAVSLLADERPGWRIDWLCGDAFLSLPRLHPAIAEVIPFERRRLGSLRGFPGGFRRLAGALRRHPYDLVIDFQGLLRSAACASLVRHAEVIGFARPRERLATLAYHRRIAVPDGIVHAVDRNRHLAAAAVGCPQPPPPRWELTGDPAGDMAGAAILAARGMPPDAPCLAVVPGARWPTKQWPPDFFVAVLREVAAARPNLHFLILGTGDEATVAERIARAVGPAAANLAGATPMAALAGVIRRCRAMLCNDTGPMHLAAALGIPVFALFGATDPARTGPYGPEHAVFQAKTDCNPCFRRYCQHRPSRCHAAIDPAAVAARILARIGPEEKVSAP